MLLELPQFQGQLFVNLVERWLHTSNFIHDILQFRFNPWKLGSDACLNAIPYLRPAAHFFLRLAQPGLHLVASTSPKKLHSFFFESASWFQEGIYVASLYLKLENLRFQYIKLVSYTRKKMAQRRKITELVCI